MAEDRLDIEQKRQKSRKVYSTEIIDRLLKDNAEGYDIDFEPFFNRDPDLRNSNVTFRMTKEEKEIYDRCLTDPLYFIENYCKFLTDDSRKLVKLRDYQKDIVNIITDEKYDEDLDMMVPVNRSIIWLASRQVGKCISASESITYDDKVKEKLQQESIISLYNKNIKNSLLKHIKSILYKVYSKI